MLLAVFAGALAGCSGLSDDPNTWYNMTIVENLAGGKTQTAPAAAPVVIGSSTTLPPGQPMPPPPGQQVAMAPANMAVDADLYRSEMSCGGLNPNPPRGGPPASAVGSIALEMTECDVARRIGVPDKVELGTGLRGERILTLTYSRGERPRIYRFASGRLIGIETLPAAARRR